MEAGVRDVLHRSIGIDLPVSAWVRTHTALHSIGTDLASPVC